jgi:hypothetical protein
VPIISALALELGQAVVQLAVVDHELHDLEQGGVIEAGIVQGGAVVGHRPADGEERLKVGG